VGDAPVDAVIRDVIALVMEAEETIAQHEKDAQR
jgi:hypothetical protein